MKGVWLVWQVGIGKGGKSESEWSRRKSGQESEGKSGFGSVSRTRGRDQS